MKNWYKTIQLEERDVLVTKEYNEEEDSFEIAFKFFIVDGVSVTHSIGYGDEEDRDKAFLETGPTFTINIVDSLLKMLK